MSRDISVEFKQFCDLLGARLEAGRQAYGDVSFTRATDALLGEVEEELLDVCGWSVIAWIRIQALRERARAAELGLPHVVRRTEQRDSHPAPKKK